MKNSEDRRKERMWYNFKIISQNSSRRTEQYFDKLIQDSYVVDARNKHNYDVIISSCPSGP